MMTADLVAFIRARLDEDEQLARAASPGPWHANEESDEVLAEDGFALSGRQLRATTEHIARHDPARVLAEVEAKRRIVDVHRVVGGWEDEGGNDHGLGCAECGHSEEYGDRGGWCETLRLLALPYADHPAYREDWRP